MDFESQEYYEFLGQFVTEERLALFDEVLAQRTRHITVAIEDIYQPHNASAVLRSCDCFGIQDVHIIENRNKYNINPKVALGSGKWITMHKHNELENNSVACVNDLKKRGYKVLATTPHTDDIFLDDIDITEPVALVFGNEKEGISDEVRSVADGFVRIPMYGFTESFNISVSAAVCLNVLANKIRKTDLDWGLSESEQLELKLKWLKKHLGSQEAYEKEFLERK